MELPNKTQRQRQLRSLNQALTTLVNLALLRKRARTTRSNLNKVIELELNWVGAKKFLRTIFILSFLFSVGCGVRGSPLPPKEPVYIGRGSPQAGSLKKKTLANSTVETVSDTEQDPREEEARAHEQETSQLSEPAPEKVQTKGKAKNKKSQSQESP